MADKAQRSRVRFRPHFKTHQSAQVGAWFRQVGVEAITVSSVEMALYFAHHGWQDITVAFSTNILEIEAINRLAKQIRLGLLVESEATIRFLGEHLAAPVDLWLKVDVGYGRTGLGWLDFDRLAGLARQIDAAPHMSLQGLLTHSGHTYKARSGSEVEAIYQDTVAKLKAIRENLTAAGLGPVALSIGDTPSCSLVEDLSDVDEIRPGNFVFYDLTQRQIGACEEADIAVAVACPVVAKHPEQQKLVIYGGAIHHSKEFIFNRAGVQIFGKVARLEQNGWGAHLKDGYLAGLSQEHGLIKASTQLLDQIDIGDLVAILPVHSCLTVNLMGQYLTLDGEIYSCM
jgi:D-serine deaminase-like pyridoxal phosphate-dependent protein